LDGPNTICARALLHPNGAATCSSNALSVGSHLIKATYSGDENFTPSLNWYKQNVLAAASADLEIAMSTSDVNESSGELDTFVIKIGNKGPTAASAVVMTDMLPAGLVFESVSANTGACSGPALGQTGPIICTLPAIPPSSGWDIFVNVKITAPKGTTVTNTATVSSATADPNPANNASSVTLNVVN
jgi:uncharacterized repeat protein (TIGR01451 family)